MIMLTQQRLKELISYDPETGISVRIKSVCSRGQKGMIPGWIDDAGYRRVEIDGKVYKHSRLAWLYMTGEFPELDIDHEDLDKSNDKWSNLREATRPQNVVNTARRKTNTSGKTGVTDQRQGYVARLGVNGRRIYLGTFQTLDGASTAYDAAARKHFGEFARLT